MEWKGPREWAIERDSVKNKKKYVKKWGYELEIVDMSTKKRYAHEWRESWEKVDTIRNCMRKYPKAEWYVIKIVVGTALLMILKGSGGLTSTPSSWSPLIPYRNTSSISSTSTPTATSTTTILSTLLIQWIYLTWTTSPAHLLETPNPTPLT